VTVCACTLIAPKKIIIEKNVKNSSDKMIQNIYIIIQFVKGAVLFFRVSRHRSQFYCFTSYPEIDNAFSNVYLIILMSYSAKFINH
jgi:hypothetical protein